jgi:hypothetical protein
MERDTVMTAIEGKYRMMNERNFTNKDKVRVMQLLEMASVIQKEQLIAYPGPKAPEMPYGDSYYYINVKAWKKDID